MSLDVLGKRWPTVVALTIAMLVAFYTGFRVPNAWSATFDCMSIFDGLNRRWVVGTLLRPLALLTDYNYWLFAAFSFVLLAIVLAVLARNAFRTQLISRRMLIIAWLLMPTGGFLFHEVGYFEQLNYLLLFASIWLLHRERLIAAVCIMSITPFIHEIAIVTSIPIFGVVALRKLPLRKALVVTAIPAALDLIVLAIPPARAGTYERLTEQLATANFPVRDDALGQFKASWVYYTNHDIVAYVLPIGAFMMFAFIMLWLADGKLFRGTLAPIWILLASCAAIGLPSVLVVAGWDFNRWAFLIITNFFIVLWISLDERIEELTIAAIAVLALTLLLLTHVSLPYFDRYQPRELGYQPIRAFVRSFDRLLEIPSR